jgi:hypothetical protein
MPNLDLFLHLDCHANLYLCVNRSDPFFCFGEARIVSTSQTKFIHKDLTMLQLSVPILCHFVKSFFYPTQPERKSSVTYVTVTFYCGAC